MEKILFSDNSVEEEQQVEQNLYAGLDIIFPPKKCFDTCLDLLKQEETQPCRIATGIKQLDEHLFGGVKLRQITELVGKSGSGKTNLCLQLCLNVQLPTTVGGLQGSALFIDTRRDFHPMRLKELAQQLVNRQGNSAAALSADDLVHNVKYLSCPTVSKLCASVFSCHRYVTDMPAIKLIVIDSLSFCLRMHEPVFERTTLLIELHESFRQLLKEHDVALVLTNELTTHRKRRRYVVTPALGDMHAHYINKRIWLEQQNNCYVGKTLRTRRLLTK